MEALICQKKKKNKIEQMEYHKMKITKISKIKYHEINQTASFLSQNLDLENV